MTIDRLAPRFVEFVPETIDPGMLYVSLEHGSIVHLCACGCGSEVVLPLTPIDWKITYDGENVSLWPSVGSWSLPCRSHYVIDDGRVRWAREWTDDEISAGRRRDRRRREAREGTGIGDAPPAAMTPKVDVVPPPQRRGLRGLLTRVFGK
jgi:hypothetical protein